MRKLLKRDEGFTLIELMVVVLIIGILVAIALPTFLGARTRAQDKAAQSNLRNGMAAAKVYYTDTEDYTNFDAAEGELIEPSLTWVDGVAAAPAVNEVAVGPAPNTTTVQLVATSASGTLFCVKDVTSTGTFYDSGAAIGDVDTFAECIGTSW